MLCLLLREPQLRSSIAFKKTSKPSSMSRNSKRGMSTEWDTPASSALRQQFAAFIQDDYKRKEVMIKSAGIVPE